MTATEWYKNPRGTVVHAYVKGPGTGDASLCGQVLAPDAERHAPGRRCTRCVTATNEEA